MPDLTTLADVRTQLRLPAAFTTDDAYLSATITGVSDWIHAQVRRLLAPAAGEITIVDTAAGNVIPFPRGIRVLTTLVYATTDQPDTGGAWPFAVAASSIALRPPALARAEGMPATAIAVLGSAITFSNAINGAKITSDNGPAAIVPRAAMVARDAVAAAYGDRRVGTSGVLGADAAASIPWADYFRDGSPQARILEDLKGYPGIA